MASLRLSNAEQLKNGLGLYSAILSALEPWAEKLSVLLPRPLEETSARNLRKKQKAVSLSFHYAEALL